MLGLHVFRGTLYILYKFFFVCVFIWLPPYRCDGHAAIFKFQQNSFHVHVLTRIVLPSSAFFLSTAVKLSMFAYLGKNKMTDWLIQSFGSHLHFESVSSKAVGLYDSI